MLTFALVSSSGWLMMVLLLAIGLYPFVLRAGMLGPIQPFLTRMRLHYWLAYICAGLLLVHLWVSTSGPLMQSAEATGLDLATLAMVLFVAQIVLGLCLRSPTLSRRRSVRRSHFWLMLALLACVLAHVALNSGTLRLLFVS
jgi:hypothetical protein